MTQPETSVASSAHATELVHQPHGGALRRGNPGNRGRSLDSFKERMRALASDEHVLDYLHSCLRGDHGPKHAIAAWQIVTAHGYGPPLQRIESRSSFASIDLTRLSDEQLMRIVNGEHPLSVLGAGVNEHAADREHHRGDDRDDQVAQP